MNSLRADSAAPDPQMEQGEDVVIDYKLRIIEIPSEDLVTLRFNLGLPGFPDFPIAKMRKILLSMPREYACALLFRYVYGVKKLEVPSWLGFDPEFFGQTVENLARFIKEKSSELDLSDDDLMKMLTGFIRGEDQRWRTAEA